MKFVVLLTGEGGGCDYTIGCNMKWEKFEANSVEEAEKKVKKIIKKYDGNDVTIKHAELLRIHED